MQATETPVNIQFDRNHFRGKLFFSVFIIAMGLLYLFMPKPNPHSVSNQQWSSMGYFFIIPALILAFYSLKKLTTGRPGFSIDSKSLHDYSGVFDVGPVLKHDITHIKTRKWQKMIVIYVNNPQAYINDQKNRFKKFVMSLNWGFFGSPFCITAEELNISLDKLFEEVDRDLKHEQ